MYTHFISENGLSDLELKKRIIKTINSTAHITPPLFDPELLGLVSPDTESGKFIEKLVDGVSELKDI